MEIILKEPEVTLNANVLLYCAQEAVKKQCVKITSTFVTSSHVQAVQKTSLETSHKPRSMCPGCKARHHQGGRQNCLVYHATWWYVLTVAKLATLWEFATIVDNNMYNQQKELQHLRAWTQSYFSQWLSQLQPLWFRSLCWTVSQLFYPPQLRSGDLHAGQGVLSHYSSRVKFSRERRRKKKEKEEEQNQSFRASFSRTR